MRMVMCSCPPGIGTSLARGLIAESLAACVQVLPRMKSVYRWQGEICEDEEVLLLCKTTAEAVAPLTAYLQEHHPYDVPEIIAVPIAPDEGNPAYLSWLVEQVDVPG